MKLPITGWKKALRTLGYKVLWDNVRRKKRRSNSSEYQPHRYETLEPRKLLANDLFINVSADTSAVVEGSEFTVNFEAPEADVAVDFWEIDWGYGNSQTVPGTETSLSHVYDQLGEYDVSVTAHFDDGQQASSNLSLDSSFGINGTVTTDFFGGADEATSVLVQPDGKVLVGGTITQPEITLEGGDDFTFSGSQEISITGRAVVRSDNFFPVDVDSSYRISVDASSGDGLGAAYDPATKHYLGFTSFDVDKKEILPFNYYRHSTAVDTRLAVELKPGDTTIVLNDATGWYDGSAEHIRTIAFYDYADSTGHVYEDYTYTRNYKRNLWDAGSIDGNVITLRTPWTGETIEAGRAVRNTRGAGTFNYVLAGNYHIGEDTESRSAVFGGGRGDTLYAGIRPGTAYVKALVLANYRDAGDNQLNLSNYRVDPVEESEGDNFGLMRFGEDGTPDLSFGTSGKVSVDFRRPGFTADASYDLAIQDDGKIIQFGRSNQGGSQSYDMALVRYESDGSVDTSFGEEGLLLLDISTALGEQGKSYEYLGAVEFSGDSIFVAGTSRNYTNGEFYDYVVAKFDLNGDLVSGYGDNGSGIAKLPFDSDQDISRNLALQSDGSVVVAGETTATGPRRMVAVRLTPSGTVDTSFGPNGTGRFISSVGSVAHGIHVDELDNIFLTGSSNAVAIKLDSDGQLDSSFGTNGIVNTSFATGLGISHAYGSELQADGKLVLVGRVDLEAGGNESDKFAALRLMPDGNPDATFGDQGETVIEFSGASDIASDVAIFESGVYVVGRTGATTVLGEQSDFAIAKLHNNNSLSAIELEVSTDVDELDGDYSEGDLSLREALYLAEMSAGHNTITFASALAGQTLSLGSDSLSTESVHLLDETGVTIELDGSTLFLTDSTVEGLTLVGSGSLEMDGATAAITGSHIANDVLKFGGTVFGLGTPVRNEIDVTITSSQIDSTTNFETQGAVDLSGAAFSKSIGFGYAGTGVSFNAYESSFASVSFQFSSNWVIENSSAERVTSSFGSGGAILGSTISGSTGTGVSFAFGGGSIVNSTISGAGGVGVTASYGNVDLVNSTVTDNGGGVFAGEVSNISIVNSIVAGNAGIDVDGIVNLNSGSVGVLGSYSLIGTDNSGNFDDNLAGNIVIGTDDPGLIALADNGGPARTHALLSDSAAINAGENSRAIDADGNPLFTDQRGLKRVVGTVDVGAFEYDAIKGRHLFYNNSGFDQTSDDEAIATDIVPLFDGQTASFENYSSFASGINGVMVDFESLPEELSSDDFLFHFGNSDNADMWECATDPVEVETIFGGGVGGSDRVKIVWPDGQTQSTWLQVRVLANDSTGLEQDDVFYFGNVPAETGDNPSNAHVNIGDLLGFRQNYLQVSVDIENDYDFTRDGNVNLFDLLVLRQNFGVSSVDLISPYSSDLPEVHIVPNAIELVENDSGFTTFQFPVERTGDLSGETTVDWIVRGIGGDPANADDFQEVAGVVTFGPDETIAIVEVRVRGDLDFEADEQFEVVLVSAEDSKRKKATIGEQDSGVGTILNDDDQQTQITTISIYPVNAEHDEGLNVTSVYSFQIERTGSLQFETTVGYELIAGDTSPDDFDTPLTGEVFFAAGASSSTIHVYVNGDSTVESDETFYVGITDVLQEDGEVHVVNSVAEGTIINDDIGLNFYATDSSGEEGDFGLRRLLYGLSRDGDLSGWTTVEYAVLAGDTNDDDFFGGVPSGEVVFEPGQSSKVISIDVAGDTLHEEDEEFTLEITDYYDSQGGHSVNLNVDPITDEIIDRLSGKIINDDDTLSDGTLGPINLFEDDEPSVVDLRELFGTDNLVPLNLEISDITTSEGNADEIIDAKIYDWALRLQPKENQSGTVYIEISSSGDSATNRSLTVNIAPVNDTPFLLTQEEIDENGESVQFDEGVILQEAGESYTIDLRNIFDDIDSDSLTYAVNRIDRSPDVPQPAPHDFFGDGTTTPLESFDLISGTDDQGDPVSNVILELVPHADDFGFEQLAITATDGEGRSVSTTLWVLVEPTNDIPESIFDNGNGFLPTEYHVDGRPETVTISGSETRVLDLAQYFRDKEDGTFLTYEVINTPSTVGTPYTLSPTIGDNGFLYYSWDVDFIEIEDHYMGGSYDPFQFYIEATDSDGAKTSLSWIHVFSWGPQSSPTDVPLPDHCTDDAQGLNGFSLNNGCPFDGEPQLDLQIKEWHDVSDGPLPDWTNYIPVNENFSEGNVAAWERDFGPFESLVELRTVQDNELDRNLGHRRAYASELYHPVDIVFEVSDEIGGISPENLHVDGDLNLTIPEGMIGWVSPLWALQGNGIGSGNEQIDTGSPDALKGWPSKNISGQEDYKDVAFGNSEVTLLRAVPLTGNVSLPINYLFGRNAGETRSTFTVILEAVDPDAKSGFSASFTGYIHRYWHGHTDSSSTITLSDNTTVNVARADIDVVEAGDQLASPVTPDYYEALIPTDIVTNTRDDDFDGISDVFDGFNIDGTASVDDKSIPIREADAFLTPVTINIPSGFNEDWVGITISYNDSDPNQSNYSNFVRSNDSGSLRLWTKDKQEERDPRGVQFGGDFVESGTFNLDDFEYETSSSTGVSTITLYVEGLRTGEYPISVLVNPHANYPFPDWVSAQGPGFAPNPDIRDQIYIRVLEEVAVYASDQVGQEPSVDTSASNEDSIKFVFSRGDGNTLDQRDIYYRVVFEQNGIDEERQLYRPTDSLVVGDGSDYTASTENGSLALEDVRWFGKVTIEEGTHLTTIEVKARNEQEAYFLSEWDEFLTIEMLTYAEYRDSFNEVEARGIELPPDAAIGSSEGATTFSPGSEPQPHFYSPPLYTLFDDTDDDPENPIINNGVIGTAVIIDRDTVSQTDSRNLDIESTGLDASSIAKGPVSVDLRDGAVELLVPLGGLVYRENDNLVPIAQVEFSVPWFDETVTGMSATMTFAGISGETVDFDLSRLQEYYEFALNQDPGNLAEDFNPHRTIRLVVFASTELADQIPSGHYDYDVLFGTQVDGFSQYKTVRGSTEFINRTGTDFGSNELGQRWTLEEISRLTFNDEQTLGGNAFIPESGTGPSDTPRSSAASRLTTIGATSETSIALIRGDNTSANYVAAPDVENAQSLSFVDFSELEVPESWIPGVAGGDQNDGGGGDTGGGDTGGGEPGDGDTGGGGPGGGGLPGSGSGGGTGGQFILAPNNNDYEGFDFLISGPGEEDDDGNRKEHYLEWEVAGVEVGKPIQIFTTWTEGPNRASNVPYTIYGAAPAGGGAWSRDENNGEGGTYNKTVYVDQRFVAGELLDVDHEDSGRNWRSLGFFVPYEQEDGSVSVQVRISTKLPLLPGQTGEENRQDVDGKVVAQGLLIVNAWDTESETPVGTVSDLLQQEYTDFGDYNSSQFGIETKHGNLYEFDGHGIQISAEDRLGNRTHYHYVDADGDALYDEIGRIETQGNSVAKVFEYDGDGKVDRIYFTNSHRDLVEGEEETEFGDIWFDFSGDQLTGVTIESGVVGSADIDWNFTYRSDVPLLTSVTDGVQNTTTLNRDADGSADIGQVHGVNADGGQWYVVSDLRHEYNLLLEGDIPLPRTGLIESVFDNDSFIQPRAAYQGENHGDNFEQIWRFQTDAWGLTTTEVRPSTNTIDNTLNKWIWERDDWGLPVRYIEPSIRATKFGTLADPDADGNRPYEEWLDSLTTGFEYDNNKFLTSATYGLGLASDIVLTEEWFYAERSTASGRTAYLLDNYLPSDVNNAVSYGYDDDSNLDAIFENGRTTNFSSFTSTPTSIDSIPAGLARKSQIAGDDQVSRFIYYGDNDPDREADLDLELGDDVGRLYRGMLAHQLTSIDDPELEDVVHFTSNFYDDSLQLKESTVYESSYLGVWVPDAVPELYVPTYFKFDWLGQLAFVESAAQEYLDPRDLDFDENGIPENTENATRGARIENYYDAAGNLVETHELRGALDANSDEWAITRYYHDELNRLTKVESPGGLIGDMEYVFDLAGNLQFEIQHLEDGKTRTVEHQYDPLNQRVKTLYETPEFEGVSDVPFDSTVRPVVHYFYDVNGNLRWQTDARFGLDDGVQGPLAHSGTTFFYDIHGRLVAERQEIEQGLGHTAPVTRYVYDDGGRVTNVFVQLDTIDKEVENGDGETRTTRADVFAETVNTYDSLGRLDTTTEPANESGISRKTDVDYDLRDNVIKTTVSGVNADGDAAGGITNTEMRYYDHLDRLKAVVGDELKTVFGYDDYGFVGATYTAGGPLDLPAEFGAAGIPSIEEVIGNARFIAGTDGDVNRVLLTRYLNDRTGSTIAIVSPDLYGEGPVRMENGEPVYRENLSSDDGSTVAITQYDLSGNVTQVATNFNEPDELDAPAVQTLYENYTYDILNRVTHHHSVGDVADTEGANRITTETRYNLDGSVHSTRSEFENTNSVVEYSYDSLGRMYATSQFEESNDDEKLVSIQFVDANGNVVRTLNPNDVQVDIAYDFVNRMVESAEIFEGYDNRFEFGAPGIKDSIILTEYRYYANGLVREIAYEDYTKLEYEYDKTNNRTVENRSSRNISILPNETAISTVTVTNKFEDFDINGRAWTHDLNGNVTNFKYDDFGRLTHESQEGPSGSSVEREYHYDEFGSLFLSINRNGDPVHYIRFNTGQLHQESWLDEPDEEGELDVYSRRFTYSVLGELLSAAVFKNDDLESLYEYEYDTIRQLEQFDQEFASLDRTFQTNFETDINNREREESFVVGSGIGGDVSIDLTYKSDFLGRSEHIISEVDGRDPLAVAFGYKNHLLSSTSYLDSPVIDVNGDLDFDRSDFTDFQVRYSYLLDSDRISLEQYYTGEELLVAGEGQLFKYDHLGRIRQATSVGDLASSAEAQEIRDLSFFNAPDANFAQEFGRNPTEQDPNSSVKEHDLEGNVTLSLGNSVWEKESERLVVPTPSEGAILGTNSGGPAGNGKFPAAWYSVEFDKSSLLPFTVITGDLRFWISNGNQALKSFTIPFDEFEGVATFDLDSNVQTSFVSNLRMWVEYHDGTDWVTALRPDNHGALGLDNFKFVLHDSGYELSWNSLNQVDRVTKRELISGSSTNGLQSFKKVTEYNYDAFGNLIQSQEVVHELITDGGASPLVNSTLDFVVNARGHRTAVFHSTHGGAATLIGYALNTDSGQTLMTEDILESSNSHEFSGRNWIYRDSFGNVRHQVSDLGAERIEFDGVGNLDSSRTERYVPISRLAQLFNGFDYDPLAEIYFANGRAFLAGQFLSEASHGALNGQANLYQRVANSPSGSFVADFDGPSYFSFAGGSEFNRSLAYAPNWVWNVGTGVFATGIVLSGGALGYATAGGSIAVGGGITLTGSAAFTLASVGAGAGAISSTLASYDTLENTSLGGLAFNVGLGGVLGGMAPISSIAGLGGASIGYGVAGSQGAMVGDMLGGFVGSGAAAFARSGGSLSYARRAVMPEIYGAGIGGVTGFAATGSFDGAILGAGIGSGVGAVWSARYVVCFVADTPILVPLKYDDLAVADIEAVLDDTKRNRRIGMAVIGLGIGALAATQYLRARSGKLKEEEGRQRRKPLTPVLSPYQKFGLES